MILTDSKNGESYYDPCDLQGDLIDSFSSSPTIRGKQTSSIFAQSNSDNGSDDSFTSIKSFFDQSTEDPKEDRKDREQSEGQVNAINT